MTRQDLETLDQFELWLRAQPPFQVVGASAMACGCPLSNWGTSVFGHPMFVDNGEMWVDCGDRTVSFYLSEMCALFINKIDAFAETEITAREAIEILQECRWEMASTTMGIA